MTDRSTLLIDKIPHGTVRAPASKSIGHRALICAALAGEESAIKRIKNLPQNDDIAATRTGILQIVSGNNAEPVKCGESGSTLRFLIPLALALFGDRPWTFTGQGRLMARPLEVYKEAFASRGISFAQEAGGITVAGTLSADRYELPGNVSSQFITGLMLALPLLEGESEIVTTSPLESAGYVELTADVMDSFGVMVEDREPASSGARCWRISGGQHYKGARYEVEGDWSQAAFFLCASAIGARVVVEGLSLSSLQGDRRIVNVLKSMGADVDAFIPPGLRAREKNCTISAFTPQAGLTGIDLDVSDIPDLVPPIAALACYAKGRTRLTSAGRLRLKESDRIAALVTELGWLGADIRADGDTLIINGREHLIGGEVCAWNDHRIAMALAVASVGCTTPVELTEWESVSKSYPSFWNDFCGVKNPHIQGSQNNK